MQYINTTVASLGISGFFVQFYTCPRLIKAHRFHVLPPLKNHSSKPIGFMYSPLWKITHQKPLVSCTPPFEKSLIKAHRFHVLPPLKNHCFWWALISGWAFISANTVYLLWYTFKRSCSRTILKLNKGRNFVTSWVNITIWKWHLRFENPLRNVVVCSILKMVLVQNCLVVAHGYAD